MEANIFIALLIRVVKKKNIRRKKIVLANSAEGSRKQIRYGYIIKAVEKDRQVLVAVTAAV
jgi:hypothetical protein